MTLLVLWCDSYLDSEDIDRLRVDYFACLYTQGFPYEDFDDHFLLNGNSIFDSKRFQDFLIEMKIKKIIFHSYELNTSAIKKQFFSLGIEFVRFKRNVIKRNIPFF